MATLQAIKYSRGKLLVLDQLRLPHEHHYDEVSTAEEAFDCIRSMRVRGEPSLTTTKPTDFKSDQSQVPRPSPLWLPSPTPSSFTRGSAVRAI